MNYINLKAQMKSTGINLRISKVNEQLEKLSNIINNDQQIYARTKQVLDQIYSADSSSSGDFSANRINIPLSKDKKKAEFLVHQSEQFLNNIQGQTVNSRFNPINQLKQSKLLTMQVPFSSVEGVEPRTADITIKKFRPVNSQSKKKKSTDERIKQSSKTKNNKSESKGYNSSKTESLKKSMKKVEKQYKKVKQFYQSNINNHSKGVYKKMKTSHAMKTTSQNRLNESLKMHINLKKQVTMKITDLNLQKQQCQRQAEYLRSVMKVQQQDRLQVVLQELENGINLQQNIFIALASLFVNFFSQFFHEKLVSTEQCTFIELEKVLNNKNYLIKYMLKLPDILKHDNTLCQQRCRKLFQQKHMLDHRIQTHKQFQNDGLYTCAEGLSNYIQFLINNNMVRQTKRKMLPVEFNSERSLKNKKNQSITNLNINICNLQNSITIKQKEYDSERKSKEKEKECQITSSNYSNNKNSKNTLKRVTTQKMLSPKVKSRNGHK